MATHPQKRKKSDAGLGPHDFENHSVMVDALNEQVAMVLTGGKTWFIRIPEFDRAHLNLYRQSDVRAWLSSYRWIYGSATEPKTKPAFDIWIQSDKANRFEGITFDPAQDRIIDNGQGGEILNRFVGLGLDIDLSREGTYELFREHVEENLCHGDAELTKYTWDWIAQILQQPERKSGVAIMIRGDKGTGKSLFSSVIAKLIGERYCPTVDSAEAFTGRFNAHLEDALLIQVAEGYHAANPAHESKLKNMIDGKTMMVERKGFTPYTAPHFSRVLMTSNSDHVVPATGGERRFVCLDIRSTRKQDSKFFGAMLKELESGGYAQLFRDLLARDLSDCDWSNPPMTAGLSKQIRHSMKSDETWWTDLLTSGILETADETVEWDWDKPLLIERSTLYQSFREFAPGFRAPPSPALLGRFLKDVCPDVTERRTGGKGRQIRCYAFPPRREALAAFEAARPGLSLKGDINEFAREGSVGDPSIVGVSTLPMHARLAA